MAKIEVTCEAASLQPVDALTPLQGRLKYITDVNLQKLKDTILQHGFSAPVFIWRNDDIQYIVDGHQRLKALEALRDEGYEIPDVPVAYIEADSREQAMEKLLHISSQYGSFDRAELDMAVQDLNLSVESLRLTAGEIDLDFQPVVLEATEGADTRTGRGTSSQSKSVVSIGGLSELVPIDLVDETAQKVEDNFDGIEEFCRWVCESL